MISTFFSRSSSLLSFSRSLPRVSSNFRFFSVFGSDSDGILKEIQKLKEEENQMKKLKMEKELGKFGSTSEQKSESESAPPSGAPSLAAINKLRSTGRHRDDAEISDRFNRALQYRKTKNEKKEK